MAVERKVARMSDIDLEITIKENGVPVDYSSGYDNIVVFVNHADGTEMAKFSDVVASGYEYLETGDIANGKVSFRLTSEVTKLAPLGKYYYEVLARKADGTLGDGEYDKISTGNYIFTLVESFSRSATLP